MTLIATVNGPETIWLLADRRLSRRRGPPVRDDARKVMFLETTDGTAILGYAGLGATGLGTEPADWMAAVLRGRNLPFERSLDLIANAAQKQLPKHLARLSNRDTESHTIIASAFVNNEAKVYTIDLLLAEDRKSFQFRYARQWKKRPGLTELLTPRIAIGGSGGFTLLRDKRWMRPLLRIVRAHDRGQVSASAVADHLAQLNHHVHLATVDKSVGPTCIVAWRHRKGGVHKGGGAHEFYSGTTRVSDSGSIPIIARGMDISAIDAILMRSFVEQMDSLELGDPTTPLLEMDRERIDAELALLPDKPDEDLR